MDDLRLRLGQVMDRHDDVLEAYLFGSHAPGTAGPLSDIDVAVLLSDDDRILDRRLALIADVAETLRTDDVDVIVLNEVPVALAYRVLRDGVPVSCKDDLARIRHRVRTQCHACRRPRGWLLGFVSFVDVMALAAPRTHRTGRRGLIGAWHRPH